MRHDRFLPVLCFLLFLCACAGHEHQKAPVTRWDGDRAQVELSYRGSALAVHAVGDFNDWNPETNPFINTEADNWTCVLDLPPGRYGYLLVVKTESDWSWRLDPTHSAGSKDFQGRELSLLVVDDGGADDNDDSSGAERINR